MRFLVLIASLLAMAAEPYERFGSSRLRVPGQNLTAFAVSVDGRYLAAENNSTLTVFDGNTGAKLFTQSRDPWNSSIAILDGTLNIVGNILSLVEINFEVDSLYYKQYRLPDGSQIKSVKITRRDFGGGVNYCHGSILASIGKKGIELYDLLDPQKRNLLPLKITHESQLIYSADGQRLLVISPGHKKISLRVYDSSTAMRIYSTVVPVETLEAALSIDGRTLAYATAEKIDVIDLASGKTVWSANHPDLAISLAVTNTQEVRFYGGQEETLYTFDANGKANKGVKIHGLFDQVVFTSDGTKLITKTFQGAILIYDAATGTMLPQSAELSTNVVALQYLSDGTLAGFADSWITWNKSRELKRISSLAPSDLLAANFNTHGVPNGLALAADGRHNALLHDDLIEVFSSNSSGRAKRTLALPNRRLELDSGRGEIWFRGNDEILYDSSQSDSITHYSASGVARTITLQGRYKGALTSRPSPDGRLLLTLPLDDGNETKLSMQLHDCATGRLRFTKPLGDGLTPVTTFAPDGSRLAISFCDEQWQRIKILATDGGLTVSAWSIDPGIQNPDNIGTASPIAFSPDARTVACGLGPSIPLVEVASGRVRGSLDDLSTQSIPALAFAPDGRTLAVSADDGTVGLFDIAKPFLSTAATDVLFNDLYSTDAALAYRAVRTLITRPQETMTMFRAQIKPAEPIPVETIRPLIVRLGSESYAEREAATLALVKLREAIAPHLRQARAETSNEEARERIDELLTLAESPSPASLRATRAVEVTEALAIAGNSDAKALLKSWATGDAIAVLTREARASLTRLAVQKFNMKSRERE